MISHVALHDLFRFVLSMLQENFALFVQQMPDFWNPIVIKGSRIEDK